MPWIFPRWLLLPSRDPLAFAELFFSLNSILLLSLASMTITYTYDKIDNLVLTIAFETVSTNEMIEHIDNILIDRFIMNEFIEIVDMSRVRDIDITFTSAQEVSMKWNTWKTKSSLYIFI